VQRQISLERSDERKSSTVTGRKRANNTQSTEKKLWGEEEKLRKRGALDKNVGWEGRRQGERERKGREREIQGRPGFGGKKQHMGLSASGRKEKHLEGKGGGWGGELPVQLGAERTARNGRTKTCLQCHQKNTASSLKLRVKGARDLKVKKPFLV